MDILGIIILVICVFSLLVCVLREDKRMKAEHKEIMEYYRVTTKLNKMLIEDFKESGWKESEEK